MSCHYGLGPHYTCEDGETWIVGRSWQGRAHAQCRISTATMFFVFFFLHRGKSTTLFLQLAVALVQGLESAFRPVCRSPMFRPIRNISTTGTASSATQFSNLSLDNLTGPRRAMVSNHLVSWGFDGIRIAGWRSRILTALLRNEKRKMLVIQLQFLVTHLLSLSCRNVPL